MAKVFDRELLGIFVMAGICMIIALAIAGIVYGVEALVS